MEAFRGFSELPAPFPGSAIKLPSIGGASRCSNPYRRSGRPVHKSQIFFIFVSFVASLFIFILFFSVCLQSLYSSSSITLPDHLAHVVQSCTTARLDHFARLSLIRLRSCAMIMTSATRSGTGTDGMAWVVRI